MGGIVMRATAGEMLAEISISSLYALASTAELCLCDKSISIRGFMREAAVLIVLIKIMNVRYSIHLRSASANSFLRLA